MRIQDLFTLVLVLIPLISSPSFGAPIGDKCFDFSTRIDRMIRPDLAAQTSGNQGILDPSHEKDGIFWGILSGDIHLPVRNVYFLLSDHNTTKNPKVDKMGVTEEVDPHYLLRQK